MSFFSSFLARMHRFLRPEAGDTISGTVTESQNVAVGKQITQHIYQNSPPPSTVSTSEPSWAQQDIDRYLAHMRTLYATTRILGKTAPVSLEGIYTDVYLLNELTAHQRFSLEALHQRFQEGFDSLMGRDRCNGLELVQQANNLFILGKPGAGKTTFLRYMALQAAQGKVNKLPIFVTLKEWQSEHGGLMPLILKHFQQCDFPNAHRFVEQQLQDNTAILLLDGLDEVNHEKEQRRQLTQQLMELTERYPKCQCLITCRIAASDYQFPRFQEVEMADFTDEQIRTYVRNWFRDDEAKGEVFFTEFNRLEHRGLRDLASIPLLLSLLCLVFEDRLVFPLRRSELYKEALDILLKKWDSTRNIRRDTIYRGLSTDLKQQMFAAIAAESFDRGDYFFTQEFLKERIEFFIAQLPPADRAGELDGGQILQAIEAQHSILVERASGIYSFSHLTIQEYFTAKYIVDHESRGTLKKLLTTDRVTDSRWREVILLAASLLPNADEFFKQLSKVLDSLVAKDKRLMALLRWAEDKAASVSVPYPSAAVRAFYISLDIARSSTIARARAFDSDTGHARPLDSAHALARTLDLDLAYYRTLDRFLALDCDLARIRALALTLDPDFARIRALALAHTSVLGLAELHEALTALQVPEEDRTVDAWESLAEQVRTIMITYRNIGHVWNLSEEQRAKLDTYLRANQLLLKCLNVAVVFNRQAIRDSLLLPL